MGSMVSLSEIVEALEFRSDEHTMYLDRETGDLCPISGFVIRMVQRGDGVDELPEWQRPEYEWARLLLETDRMVGLPAQFDINEWEIMADFVQSVEDAGVREKLFDAIHGKGAFSRFRDAVQRLGVRDDWDQFREEALREIAMEWCEEQKIPYEIK
jgi:hypothetical protein